MKKKLFKSSIIIGTIGLIMIFSVMVSNPASPDMAFRIGLIGLLFVFISVILGFISWLYYLIDAIRKKEYVMASIIAVLGLRVIIKVIITLYDSFLFLS